jgi:hypothetical protein
VPDGRGAGESLVLATGPIRLAWRDEKACVIGEQGGCSLGNGLRDRMVGVKRQMGAVLLARP